MPAKPFLDTNVIVYAFSSGDERSERAFALVAAGGVISVQVLNEFVSVLRRKQLRDWNEIEDALGVLKTLLDSPRPLTIEVHEIALRIACNHGFSIYDSLIVASAQQANCSMLYTEDLRHGQVIDQLTIQNPFVK